MTSLETTSDVLGAYQRFGYPSAEKLYLLLNKKVGLDVIKDDLATQSVHQLYFSKKSVTGGHILASCPLDLIQIDLCFMDKFGQQNGGYKYILLCIDVFSRYAWAVPLKSKGTEDVLEAFKTIPKPVCVMSDNGSEFLNKSFTKYLLDEEIAQQTAIVGDHHALGIIDRFTLTLKNMIYKMFIANDNVKWKDQLGELINAYNHTPHSGIYNYTPAEAFTKKSAQMVLSSVNGELNKANLVQDTVKPGDSVRIRVPASKFKRGYLQKWESDVGTVQDVAGNKVFIDGKQHKINDIQVIPNDTGFVAGKALKEATKKHKVKRALAKEGVSESNIVTRRAAKEKIVWDDSLVGRAVKKTIKGVEETGKITKYEDDGKFKWFVDFPSRTEWMSKTELLKGLVSL